MAAEPKNVIHQSAHPSSHGKTSMRKVVVAIVGLPGQCKSLISNKLGYYLNWLRLPSKVFFAQAYVDEQPGEDVLDPMLKDVNNWLQTEGGVIAVLNAINAKRTDRQRIVEACATQAVQVFFVESTMSQRGDGDKSVCAGEESDVSPTLLEPLDPVLDKDFAFMKMLDVGRSFSVHHLDGYLANRIVRYLMSLHAERHTIYITRHGESEFNLDQRIGGDPPLSERGQLYATKLKEFMDKEVKVPFYVWCSTLQRTQQTAAQFDSYEVWPALDEINAGSCDELTYKEVKEQFPDVYAAREQDKYRTRYPRGESYQDVVDRLEPRILELERQIKPVLCVCHQAVARCLMAYFQRIAREDDIPYLEIPLHTVIKVVPNESGCEVEMFPLGIPCVSTHRVKGANP